MLVDGVCQERPRIHLISVSHIKSMFENLWSFVRLARKMSVLALYSFRYRAFWCCLAMREAFASACINGVFLILIAFRGAALDAFDETSLQNLVDGNPLVRVWVQHLKEDSFESWTTKFLRGKKRAAHGGASRSISDKTVRMF